MHQRVDTHPAGWGCLYWPNASSSTSLFSSLTSQIWRSTLLQPTPDMEDYDVRSAASILASVKEQEARFEQLTRALEEERRNVTLQLERANMPSNAPNSQPLAWQQVVMQVNHAGMFAFLRFPVSVCLTKPTFCFLLPSERAHFIVLIPFIFGGSHFSVIWGTYSNSYIRTHCAWCHSVLWWLQRWTDEIKPPVLSSFVSNACHWIPSAFAH